MLTTASHTKELIDALEHPKWRELLSVQFQSEPSELRKNLYGFSHDIHNALKPGVMESGLVPNLQDCERLLELGLTGQFPALDHREHARATVIGFFHALVHPSFATVIEKYHDNAPDAEMGQLLGGHSFSNFKTWDEATPEQHLAEIVDTLADWQVSWCSR